MESCLQTPFLRMLRHCVEAQHGHNTVGPSEYPLNAYVSGCIQSQAFVAFKHSQTQGHTKKPKISGCTDYIGGIGAWRCFAHSWNIFNGLRQTEWCGIEGNPREIPGHPSPAETQLQTHSAGAWDTWSAAPCEQLLRDLQAPLFQGVRDGPLVPVGQDISDCKSLHTIPQTPGTLSPFVSICRPCVISAGVTSLFSCRAKYGAIEGILRSNTNTRAVLCFEVFEVTLKYWGTAGRPTSPPRFLWQMPLPSMGPTELGTCLLMVNSGPKITWWTGGLWNNQPVDVWNNQPLGLTWWKDYKYSKQNWNNQPVDLWNFSETFWTATFDTRNALPNLSGPSLGVHDGSNRRGSKA